LMNSGPAVHCSYKELRFFMTSRWSQEAGGAQLQQQQEEAPAL
jgi:hypothetical protein